MGTVEHFSNGQFGCVFSVCACLLLSVIYVSSLYVWKSQHDRNHPSTIKRRFFSVFIMSIISPLFLYLCTAEQVLIKVSLWELLGLRLKGIIYATIVPLLITMILFLGPLSMKCFGEKTNESDNAQQCSSHYLIWLRNRIVAPLSEEFTFRACMLPLLLPCFRPTTAIFIAPVFFGVAHFHHMFEIIKAGIDFKTALFISCFQFFYTTLFGTYSAFLFINTGHFVASFIAHAFCNHMGFPDISELNSYKPVRKTITVTLFIIGLIVWCLLLNSATNPNLYQNDVLSRLATCYNSV